jgi:hypothetical protein
MLFRTKTTDKNEGGISSGAAVLDYPFLVPTNVLRASANEQKANQVKPYVNL